jgi:hypothetical protein
MLERLDNAQRVEIMIEPVPEPVHLAVQFLFAGVRERRMTDIVAQCERFSEILVQFEDGCHGSGNLGNLDSMGQPIAKVIGETGRKNLSLVFQPPESPCVNDAVAVTLKFVAIRMTRLRIPSAAGTIHWKAEPAEPGHFCDMSARAVTAERLIGPRSLLRSGSSSLRAS